MNLFLSVPDEDSKIFNALIIGKIGEGRISIHYDPETKDTSLIHIDKDLKAREWKNPDWNLFFQILKESGFSEQDE